MKRVMITVIAVLLLAPGAHARNVVYGDKLSSIESDGYKLFVSDKILNTVGKIGPGADAAAAYCADADKNTAERIGDVNAARSDSRLPIRSDAKISYSAACATYYSVVGRLKTADDVRRLWLLFADSATDDYAAETVKNSGENDDTRVLIEMKRLGIVSRYIEFFTKNKEWKLSEYTFLSQAFKSRKGKPLSPAFNQFIAALLTGNTEKAFEIVTSIDLENLGSRFSGAPPAGAGSSPK